MAHFKIPNYLFDYPTDSHGHSISVCVMVFVDFHTLLCIALKLLGN